MAIGIRLKGRVLRVAVFFAALLTGITVYLYLARANPAVYRHMMNGNPVKEPEFTIFNPFRDRRPERVAEAFLEKLKEGRCREAVDVPLLTRDYKEEVCEKENKSPLLSWQFKNRSDGAKVRMYYLAHRKTYQDYQGQLWIIVENRGGEWQVVNYECFYQIPKTLDRFLVRLTPRTRWRIWSQDEPRGSVEVGFSPGVDSRATAVAAR